MSMLMDDDTQGRRLDGLIGIQCHVGPPMKIEVKNIRLKKLYTGRRNTMPMVFAGVDGTGPDDNAKYKEAFQRSFVKTIFQRCPTIYKQYWRGPTTAGLETSGLSDEVVAFVEDSILSNKTASATRHLAVALPHGQVLTAAGPTKKPDPIKVCLAGYSRGGAAVIMAAADLDPIHVDYLILFDAVDRSPNFSSAAWIPKNVKEVWYPRRDSAAGSREGFGNCGNDYLEKFTNVHRKKFYATHGGIGGTPWCTDPDLKARLRDKDGRPSAAWNEKIQEIDPDSEAKAIGAAEVAGAVSPLLQPFVPMVEKRIEEEANTNVTFKQDLDGSRAVWEWIAPQLAAKGIITSADWPGNDIKSSLAHGSR
jgi:hypothetical protein